MQAMYFKLNICLGFHTLQNHSQVLSKLAGMSPTKIPKIYTQDDPINKNHAGESPCMSGFRVKGLPHTNKTKREGDLTSSKSNKEERARRRASWSWIFVNTERQRELDVLNHSAELDFNMATLIKRDSS